MSPDPDQTTSDVSDREDCSENQTLLPWTSWIPFTATKDEFRKIPKEPGLYRIRPKGKNFLMYIGETRRTLHQRLQDLRMELRTQNLMPWADPHTEAPALWAWQDAEQFEYECSAAPLDASANCRQGMKQYHLYRYRLENGQSPLCNFGRFHPRYRISTSRKENLRGGKLEDGQKDNPAGDPGYPPLPVTGVPGKTGWMGLSWSTPAVLMPETVQIHPDGPGLYFLIDSLTGEIELIGQSGNCVSRLLDLSRKSWEGKQIGYSIHRVKDTVRAHQLREWEADLTGNYFERYRKAPEYQFRNNR